jgi:hypothetical protein
MRKTFIEMGLSLSDITPVYDTFHGVTQDSHLLLSDTSTWRYHVDQETTSVK